MDHVFISTIKLSSIGFHILFRLYLISPDHEPLQERKGKKMSGSWSNLWAASLNFSLLLSGPWIGFLKEKKIPGAYVFTQEQVTYRMNSLFSLCEQLYSLEHLIFFLLSFSKSNPWA